MKKIEKTKTIASLLSRALTLTSGISEYDSVRYHIRLALNDIKKLDRKSNKPKAHEEWWDKISSGASAIAEGNYTSTSSEASMKKVLFNLDSMIKEETDKLNDLEIMSTKPKEIKNKEIEPDYDILHD